MRTREAVGGGLGRVATATEGNRDEDGSAPVLRSGRSHDVELAIVDCRVRRDGKPSLGRRAVRRSRDASAVVGQPSSRWSTIEADGSGQEHPEGPPALVALTVAVDLLRLAEDRGVQPDRAALEEDLPLCLANIDGAHFASGDDRGRTFEMRGCRACAQRS